MGIRSSCEVVSIATAKLIHENGQLQEFSYSVRVSYLLRKLPFNFICDSDSMEFDGFVRAIHCDEQLKPGHLYFSLPLSKLKYPFPAEEMAALAVKASFALTTTGSGYGLEAMNPTVDNGFSGEEKRRSSVGEQTNRKTLCRGSRHDYASTLSMIQE